MKFKLTREAILPSVQLTAHVSPSNTAHPLFSHLHFAVAGKNLTVTGSDGDCTLFATAAAEVERDGDVLLPSQKIHEICRHAKAGSVLEFDLSKDKVQVKSDKTSYTLAVMDAKGFTMPAAVKGEEISLPAQDLHWLLEKTLCCMATTDFRNYLLGTLLHLTDDGINAVATDTHRLCLATWAGKSKAGPQVIVPRRAVQELLRMLAQSTGQDPDEDGDEGEGNKGKGKGKSKKAANPKVRVTLGTSSASFEVGALTLHTSLINGTYPDYTRVVPDEADYKPLRLNKDVLRLALQRMAVVSGKGGAVHWNLEGSELKVQASNTTGEEAEEQVATDFSGTALRIGFNVDYQLAILDSLDGDDVQLMLNSESDIVVMRDPSNESLRYMLMPLRL